jgi:predicted phage terminase large subunit-like protein
MPLSASLAELPSLDEVREERARRSLDAFAYRMLGLEPVRHHRFVNEKLEAVERGEIERLMLFEPPGHAKSTYASHLFPGWYLGRNPHRSVIAASHTAQLATRFGRKVRNLFASPDWPFEDVALAGDSRAADQWETTVGGEYFAVGVGGAVTGRRADLAVVDDPIKGRKDADSITVRENLWEWYRADLHNRLKPGAAIILIQTRWHEDDLAGRILPEDYQGETGWVAGQDGESWFVVNLPALAEAKDALKRKLGAPLWPEWITLEKLEIEKVVQGPRNWAALYQQRPAPEEGNFFLRDWWRWYETAPPKDTLRIYAASDYAVTAHGGDFTVHGVGGVDADDNLYILDWWRDQTASDVWVETLLDLMQTWRPLKWAEEKGQIEKSVGPFIDKRMRDRRVYCHREQYASAADKPTRAQAFRARMAMGKIFWPRNAPWVDDVYRVLMTFPTGTVDDDVDVLSLFGRMLDPVQVFDQVAVQNILSEDVKPLFGSV